MARRLADLPRPGCAKPPPARLGDAMTNSQPHLRKPTAKQLRYLKDLATAAGESFAYPSTFGQASAEIKRLLRRERTPAEDRRRERLALSRDLARGAAR